MVGISNTLILSARETTRPRPQMCRVAGIWRGTCLNIKKRMLVNSICACEWVLCEVCVCEWVLCEVCVVWVCVVCVWVGVVWGVCVWVCVVWVCVVWGMCVWVGVVWGVCVCEWVLCEGCVRCEWVLCDGPFPPPRMPECLRVDPVRLDQWTQRTATNCPPSQCALNPVKVKTKQHSKSLQQRPLLKA